MESKELALRAAAILDNKKASSVKVLKVRDLTVLTDYFVIASGNSSTHVKSLAEEVDFQLDQKYGVKPDHTEGMDARNWIVLDYGEVIVNVFYPEARSYYDLDHMWADGEEVDITEFLAAQAQEKTEE